MNDTTRPAGSGATGEPSVTQKNSATVKGEEKLAGTSPSSYGSRGGAAPQADESSGENGSEAEDALQTEGLQPE